MPEDKLQHTRVLIVEDEPMLAFTLEDLLVEAGFEVIGIAGKLEKALALIGSAVFDVAVVDANLAGVSASPIASALTARDIPFVVLSGYSAEQLQGAFPGAVFMKKPCRPAQLIQSLNKIALQH